MKVIMLNSSPHKEGCTYTALCEVAKTLAENDVESEILWLGNKAVRDCIACGECSGNGACIFDDDRVNEFIEKAAGADGFVFGSPVYYAHPSGRLLSFLDRAFYACSQDHIYPPFIGKPGAAVLSARRGGTTASFDAINKYFAIASMPVVTSTYWNMVHGQNPDDVRQDLEGLQIMRNLGRNMAWMIRHLRDDDAVADAPQLEVEFQTNFIH